MGLPDKFEPAPVPDFPKAPEIDGCDDDCATCDRMYDPGVVKSIDMETSLYGGVSPFSVHVCCLTGRIDWAHDITTEPNTVACRIGSRLASRSEELTNQDRVVLSNVSLDASNRSKDNSGTEVMILGPAWSMVTNIKDGQESIDHLFSDFILAPQRPARPSNDSGSYHVRIMGFRAVILICSHMRRDARCGKTAPILYDEFDEQLRERDLLYDPDENKSETGRVAVGFVSHIGGHRFAGNVLVYRRDDAGQTESIWLGRVFPHHVKHIVEETVVKGRVHYPLLRGGVIW